MSLKNSKVLVAFLATVVGAIMIIASFFTPIASLEFDNDTYTKKYEREAALQDFELDEINEELEGISLYKMYEVSDEIDELADAGELADVADFDLVAKAIVALPTVFAVLALLVLLFALLRKPILTAIFSILSAAIIGVLSWGIGYAFDVATEEVGSNAVSSLIEYELGAAQYIAYAGAAFAVVGSIVLLVLKIMNKKAA